MLSTNKSASQISEASVALGPRMHSLLELTRTGWASPKTSPLLQCVFSTVARSCEERAESFLT